MRNGTILEPVGKGNNENVDESMAKQVKSSMKKTRR